MIGAFGSILLYLLILFIWALGMIFLIIFGGYVVFNQFAKALGFS